MKNLEQLRVVIADCRNKKQVAGYVCIGYGNPYPSPLTRKYGIPTMELWSYERNGQFKNNCYEGTLTEDLYYVTEAFYNTHINPQPVKPMTKRETYVAMQKAFIKETGLKVGSKVRVIAKAVDNQFGWGNTWESEMTRNFDSKEILTVIGLNKDVEHNGIELNNSERHSFPFFCLEVVTVAEKMRITKDYEAEIDVSGNVQVGCQNIPYYTLKELFEKATKLKTS